MATVTHLADHSVYWEMVADCPMGSGGGTVETCRACRFNHLDPGEARVGCMVRTPGAVLDQALARLQARSEGLHAELLTLLRQSRRIDPELQRPAAQRWLDVAVAWHGLAANADALPAELEVATLIARFAEAALKTSLTVEILA